ncbi:MAG: NAD-dependent epimerase/dehydratase family protein [Pseudomonadota bacterium]|nr:NAD-dependent epimerase/dehydratase family protein [Pseudomonadota bacterium]
MAQTVLVTGGTGYIGGELIDQLLAAGKTVHTTVRNVAKSEPRLRSRWPDAGERLKVFQADLMSDDGWAQANAGCDGVAHVASPFPLATPRNKDELVIPAREGTLRALRFAKEAGVERFVQTSSAAAIAYGHPAKDHFDHTDWTNIDAGVAPYIESKTVAERSARDWVEANAPEMVFCSVNPVAVFGPVVNDDLSTSIEMVKQMANGTIPAMPNMGISVCDVRDVAKVHAMALDAPADDIRGERFPCATKFMWMAQMGDVLRARTPELAGKVATRKMPDFVVRMLAPFVPAMKQVKNELNNVRDVSGRHTEEVLGFTFISPEQSLEDTLRSLVDLGIVKV